MTASKDYNLIVKELEEDFGEESRDFIRFKDMLDKMPAQAYSCVWDEYKDKANMFSLCFIVESTAALFATTNVQ